MKRQSFFRPLAVVLIFLVWTIAEASGFQHYAIDIQNDQIVVSFSIQSEEFFVKDLKEGSSKEVLVYADLFRHWDILPDEFVTGVKIIVDLYSDPLKGEYIASKYDGKRSIVKRFKSVESMLEWAFEFKELKVAKMRGYDEGDYFVKIKAEAYSDTVVSLLAKLLLIQPKDFSYEKVLLRFRWQSQRIVPER